MEDKIRDMAGNFTQYTAQIAALDHTGPETPTEFLQKIFTIIGEVTGAEWSCDLSKKEAM